MALLRMLKGVSTALPAVSANTEGTIFYTYDDSLFHLDYKNENGELVRKTLNAELAESLLNARTITLTGDVSGSVSFDGSQNVDILTTISNDFVTKIDLNALETVLTGKIDDISANIKTYNNLEQIGLSNDDMSATDFLANIKAINTALGEDDSILYLTTTNADNLHLSAIDKLSSDMGREIGYVDYTECYKLVAVSDYGSSNVAAYSEDGINWEQSIMPISTRWGSITYGNGKFVAIDDVGNHQSSTNIAAYSEDGINWKQSAMPVSAYWDSVTYGNGKFVAITTYDTDIAAYSEDGINWKQSTMPVLTDWSSVTYGNGKFVAVARNTVTAAYSEDGINWKQSTMPISKLWWSVTYGNGKFVAITHGDNVVAYSEDGINWEQSTMPKFGYWTSITYGNGKFVVVSKGFMGDNVVAYSEDGINWEQSTMPVSAYWMSVTFHNGKFVAVSGNTLSNIVAYSEDGINWEQSTMPVSAGWSAVTYGSQFSKQYTSVPLSLKISRTGNAYNAITIDLIYNSGVEATYIYSCVYNKETDEANDTLSKFVITTHPKGFVSKEEVSSDAAMKLLYELGIIDPIISSNGEILTDENGNIFVF